MNDTNENQPYVIPTAARIGHVHLKVTDLQRSLDFYCGILGFQLKMMYGENAAFIAAGDYHHHIGLNTWHSKGKDPAPINSAGLYHVAILYPGRKDLAFVLQRLMDTAYPLVGASDHGVSEAIYLNDPDQNGLELYWDKPKEQWPHTEDGKITMFTQPLNLENLLKELKH